MSQNGAETRNFCLFSSESGAGGEDRPSFVSIHGYLKWTKMGQNSAETKNSVPLSGRGARSEGCPPLCTLVDNRKTRCCCTGKNLARFQMRLHCLSERMRLHSSRFWSINLGHLQKQLFIWPFKTWLPHLCS